MGKNWLRSDMSLKACAVRDVLSRHGPEDGPKGKSMGQGLAAACLEGLPVFTWRYTVGGRWVVSALRGMVEEIR